MKIYEFRISLRDIEPSIWRRVRINADCSFWELHCALQDAMGWWDSHLHAFHISTDDGERVEIGIPDPDGMDSVEVLAGWKTRVDEYLSKEGDRALYSYDFGDGWEHDLVLEKVLEAEDGTEYPRCVDGARACPPEDCGGPLGYGSMLGIIADPEREEHESMMEWLDGGYDPEKFVPGDVYFLDAGKRLRSLLMDFGESDTGTGYPEDVDDGPMSLDDIMERLTCYRGEFQRRALEAAIERREETAPLLLKALEDFVERPEVHVEDEDRVLYINALILLAQFRETRACPLVLEVCRLSQEHLDTLFGEFLTEYMDRIIASVFDGDMERIKAVVEDASLYEYARASALTSLQILVHMGELKREDVIDYYMELFRCGLEKEYSLVWDELACEAVDLHAVELADDIREKFEAGLLDPTYMTPMDAKMELAMSEEKAIAKAKDLCRGPVDDTVSILENWFHPNVESTRHPVLEDLFETSKEYFRDGLSLKRVEPKVGRNDPCPCGSGKKYKKCCGQ